MDKNALENIKTISSGKAAAICAGIFSLGAAAGAGTLKLIQSLRKKKESKKEKSEDKKSEEEKKEE